MLQHTLISQIHIVQKLLPKKYKLNYINKNISYNFIITLTDNKMKKNKTNLIDKQNILLQNIITNSRQGSRRKLKSISIPSVKHQLVKQIKSNRYQDKQNQNINLGDTIQLPTFGDWKAQVKGLKQTGISLHKSQKLNSIQQPIYLSSNTEQEQRPINQRLKHYEQLKLKQFTCLSKSKFQCLPLKSPVLPQFISNNQNSTNITTYNSLQNQPRQHRRSLALKQSLSSRVRALSRQFQNFETIDDNLNKIINRKQIFRKLYLKQKEKYQQVLKKHQIEEKIDDSQFQNYFRL